MRHFSRLSDPELAALLIAGGVGVLPTDTVYGLAAQASNSTAVTQLYALKNREHKPGTLIAADAAQLAKLGLDPAELAIISQYWPGPVSAIIAASDSLQYLHQGVGSLAVRVPADEQLRTLLRQTGPLVTSSANAPGEPPATNLAEAQAYFGDHVAFYVDGGDLSGRAPSTIIRLLGDKLEIIREGAAQIKTKGNT